LYNINGIGNTQIQSITKFFLNKTNLNVLSELEKNLKIQNMVLIDNKGLLNNKTFMLTGKLNGVSRAEAKSLIEQNSGKIINKVNKKLNYLIVGEKPTTKKINTARELNIKIIDQKEWFKMLNKPS
jgi:DNA ligase (NAD+)